MRRTPRAALGIAALAACFGSAAVAAGQPEIYRAMGIRPDGVLSGTILQARILEGDAKQTVAMVTYLTGKKEQDDAVGVKLAVLDTGGKEPRVVYSRDFAAESDGPVARGEVELVDLDGDGRAEILPSWDTIVSKVIDERRAEVVFRAKGEFTTAWSGLLSYDATRAAREVPADRRDRYERTIDVAATMRSRGETLFTKKKTLAVAGERLDPPKETIETFPLAVSPPPG